MKLAPVRLGLLGALPFCVFTMNAKAVEGGLGRSLSGAGIMPYAGIIPPEPGWIVSVSESYYEGDLGGNRTVPVAGNLVANLDLKFSFTPVTAVYIWNTKSPQWNFASGVTLPYAWLEAKADGDLGPFKLRREDSASGLFDMVFTPLSASYHISKTDHLAFNLNIWAPTGEYEEGALANLSLNNWTFIPGVAFTHLIPEQNIEISGSLGIQFYTENPATDYQNGIMTDMEFMALKRFPNGFGMGVVGSWIEQLSDDEGGASDFLNGFSGRAFGVGPMLTYSTKVEGHSLDFHARWIHEFENEDLLEGDLFMLGGSVKF